MAVRPIDANELYRIEKLLDTDIVRQDKVALNLLEQVLYDIQHVPTLTPPNEWVSVEERLPEPGERVLATDCGFVGEFYINKRGKWQRYNVNCSELLMALDILYWMPLPAPPDKDNNVPAKTPNEPLTLEHLRASPHGKIKDSTLQSICNRANEIACRPTEGEEGDANRGGAYLVERYPWF